MGATIDFNPVAEGKVTGVIIRIWGWAVAMQIIRGNLQCPNKIHGSLNVPIEHHPTIRYMVYNGYYQVMSNIPKMGQLPTPENSWRILDATAASCKPCCTQIGVPKNEVFFASGRAVVESSGTPHHLEFLEPTTLRNSKMVGLRLPDLSNIVKWGTTS